MQFVGVRGIGPSLFANPGDRFGIEPSKTISGFGGEANAAP